MRTLADRLVKIFTSLRLTVILLAFAIVLVFIGTLAQVDAGLYQVQADYFKSVFAGLTLHPLRFTGIAMFGYTLPIILPGGYLIGTLLLLNLIASHIYRFQLTFRKAGIQLAHAGVILLLLGQLATDMLAHESQLEFAEGQTKSFSESSMNYELAFMSPDGSNSERVVALPARLLARGGDIQNANLPFTIRVKRYWKNSNTSFRAPMMKNGPVLATNGVATSFDFSPTAVTEDLNQKNIPTALIEIIGPNGSLGDWVVSDWSSDNEMVEALKQSYAQEVGAAMAQNIADQLTQPQSITVGGKKFTFALRPQRTYFPFSLELLKATHAVYEGTDIPKDFRSLVRLQNPQTGENRDVEISMNHPLRYDGLTFYQYQMTAGQAVQQAGITPSSVLQVVHNPGWLTPYVGCAMVAAGLVIQFMFHLVGFVSKRKAK